MLPAVFRAMAKGLQYGRSAAGWAASKAPTVYRAGRGRVPARGILPGLGRAGAKALEYGWMVDGLISNLSRAFNLPTLQHSISCQVIGDPNTELRKIHWYAMSVALGRINLAAAGTNPYSIVCVWNVREKKVTVQLAYVIANLPFVPLLASTITDANTLAGLKESYSKLVAGPFTDSTGGQYPAWLVTASKSAGVDPTTLVAADGTTMTSVNNGFGLPYSTGTKLLRLAPADGSQVVPNPAPPLGDGVRSTLLALTTAALLDDPRTSFSVPPSLAGSYPPRPDNTYDITDKRQVGPAPPGAPPGNIRNPDQTPGSATAPTVITPGGPITPPTGGGY